MSSQDPDDASVPGKLRAGYRSVTPPYGPHRDPEMDAVGWVLFLGILLLLVPFLPLIVVAWLVSKALEFLADIPGED